MDPLKDKTRLTIRKRAAPTIVGRKDVKSDRAKDTKSERATSADDETAPKSCDSSVTRPVSNDVTPSTEPSETLPTSSYFDSSKENHTEANVVSRTKSIEVVVNENTEVASPTSSKNVNVEDNSKPEKVRNALTDGSKSLVKTIKRRSLPVLPNKRPLPAKSNDVGDDPVSQSIQDCLQKEVENDAIVASFQHIQNSNVLLKSPTKEKNDKEEKASVKLPLKFQDQKQHKNRCESTSNFSESIDKKDSDNSFDEPNKEVSQNEESIVQDNEINTPCRSVDNDVKQNIQQDDIPNAKNLCNKVSKKVLARPLLSKRALPTLPKKRPLPKIPDKNIPQGLETTDTNDTQPSKVMRMNCDVSSIESVIPSNKIIEKSNLLIGDLEKNDESVKTDVISEISDNVHSVENVKIVDKNDKQTISKFLKKRVCPKLRSKKTADVNSADNNLLSKSIRKVSEPELDKCVEKVPNADKLYLRCSETNTVPSESVKVDPCSSINNTHGAIRVFLNCWPQYPLDDLSEDADLCFDNQKIEDLGEVSVFINKEHKIAYCNMKRRVVNFDKPPKNWTWVNFNKLIKEEFKSDDENEVESKLDNSLNTLSGKSDVNIRSNILCDHQSKGHEHSLRVDRPSPLELERTNKEVLQPVLESNKSNEELHEDSLKNTDPKKNNSFAIEEIDKNNSDDFIEPRQSNEKELSETKSLHTSSENPLKSSSVPSRIITDVNASIPLQSNLEDDKLCSDSSIPITNLEEQLIIPFSKTSEREPVKLMEEASDSVSFPSLNSEKESCPKGAVEDAMPLKLKPLQSEEITSSESTSKKPYKLRFKKPLHVKNDDINSIEDDDRVEDIFSNNEDSDVSEYKAELENKSKEKSKVKVNVKRKRKTKKKDCPIKEKKPRQKKTVAEEEKKTKIIKEKKPRKKKSDEEGTEQGVPTENTEFKNEFPSRYKKLQRDVINQKKWDDTGNCAEPEKLSLKDFIFYVPKSEPMSQNKKEEEEGEEREVVEVEREEEEKDEEEEDIQGPRLIVRDGKIIVDPNSTRIKRTPIVHPKVVKFEKFKEPLEPWDLHETMKFYATLWKYGIDFSFLAGIFPEKSRDALKKKFQYEKRNNTSLFNNTITKKLSIQAVIREIILIDKLDKVSRKKSKSSNVPKDQKNVSKRHCLLEKKKRNKPCVKNKLRPSTPVRSEDEDSIQTYISENEIVISDDVNNLCMKDVITFSTNVVYKDMNIVESVSFHPTASVPLDVNVTIRHDSTDVNDKSVETSE